MTWGNLESRRRWWANRTPEQVERAREYNRAYREKNRDRINELAREYRRKRPNYKRAESARLRYGLTLEQYDALLAGPCGLPWCDRPSTVIDHCHKTGRIRGGLCRAHNGALGQFGDDPDLLEAAARYLRQFDASVAA